AQELIDAMRLSNELNVAAAIIDHGAFADQAFTLMRHLRARASRRHTPIVFWSSDPVKALAAGADDCVLPGVAPLELAARLQRGLATRARVDELLDETARLYELSLTDGLTQIANHRNFQERLRDEFRRAQRYDDPLAL